MADTLAANPHDSSTTVLLTGASGAIGVHTLIHLLKNTDWHIIALASYKHKGYWDRIETALTTTEHDPSRVTLFTHDLNAPFSSREIEALQSTNYILNLAALSDVYDSIEDPVPFIQNNINSTLYMLELARALPDLHSFIQFSTDEVYGPCEKDSPGHKEWDTILPSNPYAASKAAQEAIAIAYWRSYSVPVIITNTMNNFGQMQGASKYTALIQNRLTQNAPIAVHTASDGQIGTRYYIHSRNASDALLYILTHLPATRHTPGEIDRPDRYNVVGDRQMDNLELARLISDLMEIPLTYTTVDFHSEQPGHDLHYGLDGSKLKEAGWISPVTFEDSMRSTIQWQQENPRWMK